ncbi:class I SAM-dependent methyltransferase [Natrarchaeobius sp. A-rgal3]|uniref:class I SAM-dependent methyltransferase n=1 Tax=Natrarchaeobius versutus TaxID=1679078 RepID=UPI00350EF4C0
MTSEKRRVPAAATTSGPVDFAGAWETIIDDPRNRWSEEASERSFWESHAESYERRFVGDPVGVPILESMLSDGGSVLEIGPGTGRYTRELARLADRVTAVEDSPAMREKLASNLADAGFEDRVDVVANAWERADVDSHDVVVAGWSLYRQPDIEACLERILATADCGFVLVDSPGAVPPHRRIAIADGDELPSPPPRHAYYCGLLADRGVYPTVRIVEKTRERRHETRSGLVTDLLGDSVDDPQAYADALSPWLERDDGRWYYRFTIPAAIITCERGGAGWGTADEYGDPAAFGSTEGIQ